MKKIVFILCTLLPVSMMGQEAKDFASMKKAEREAYMINLALEVAQNFGPDYCKEPLTAKILKPVACDTKSNLHPEVAKNHGRKYYTVELRYAHRQVPIYVYAAKVQIWADTGEPSGVLFGNGWGKPFMETSYKDWLKRGVKQEELAKYRRPDFEFYESLSAKELKEMNQAIKEDKHRRERERVWRKVKEEKSKEQVKAGDVVQGKVTDDKGEPLMRVNVIEIDKEKRIIGHAVTDVNGSYSLKIINPKDTLMASLIQFKSVKMPISSHTINFVLESNPNSDQMPPNVRIASTASAKQTDDYDSFVKMYKQYWGIAMSVPRSMFAGYEKEDEFDSSREFTFISPEEEEMAKGPVGYLPGGPVVTIDNYCKLIIEEMDTAEIAKARKKGVTLYFSEHHEAYFRSFMLENIGLPWFHIDHEPSVLNNKELMEKINDATKRNVITHIDDKLTKKTNSDRVYVVRIPDIDKVWCEDPSLQQQLKTNATDCYGLEFYRADRPRMAMLLFINSKGGKTIDDYVEQISGYIKFDKNFKY
ncbi:MAG: hypothetical protein IKH43_04845 [Bacteroidaceae bacterium]|nr:hypothetical protein [Bacteroidaceae bacterium]